REEAAVLRARLDHQVQPLVLEIDRAFADQEGVGGVERQRAGGHDAAGDAEITERAAHRDQPVVGELELDDLGQVDSGHLHHQVADSPAAHADCYFAVAASTHSGHRVAAAGQLHVAPDLAYRVLRQFDLRQQAGQVQPAGVDVGAGADRGFTRVHADGRTDVAAGNAEVERVQPEQAVLQKQVRVH